MGKYRNSSASIGFSPRDRLFSTSKSYDEIEELATMTVNKRLHEVLGLLSDH